MPQCDWWDARRRFLCMAQPDSPGHGCDVGCDSCKQDAIAPEAVSSGPRWLRPWAVGHTISPTGERPQESRDANGVEHYLDTAEPWRYGVDARRLEIAQCWQNDGTEYFGLDVCDCRFECDAAHVPPQYVPTDRLGTCFVYHGHDWPPDEQLGTMICLGRLSPLDSGVGIDSRAGWLDQASSIRLPGTPQADSPVSCASDMMVPCAGFREVSDCGQGALEEYAGRADASHFDFIDVVSHNIAMAAPTDAADEWEAAVTAANAALTYIMDTLQPGQIDSRRRSNAGNQNFALSRYRFEFLADDPFVDGPVVATFPQSRLLAAGCPVTAEYVITKATIDISLVIENENPNDPDDGPPLDDRIIRPLFRVEVQALMANRVRITTPPCTFTRHWTDPTEDVTVTLVDSVPNRGPTVLSNGVAGRDSILYIDSLGRRFEPLKRVRWLGQLGYLTFPIAPDLVAAAGGGSLDCQSIVNQMGSVAIPAVSSHLGVPSGNPGDADPGPVTPEGQSERGIIHTGKLTLGFPAWV